ncbi:hypothetical protein [Brevibacterium album]|uniref:hypothetical protein n=1 Tax=Brevibacterium album TaxID=417948 RepID=UPI00041C5799|nr:hypothetical protein [Brevibacterium album]
MIPSSGPARIVFITLLALTGLLLMLSVGATVWSQVSYEGWVSKAVIAFVLWVLFVPCFAASGIWTLVLAVRKRRP